MYFDAKEIKKLIREKDLDTLDNKIGNSEFSNKKASEILDFAIELHDIEVVQYYLDKGVKVGNPQHIADAAGKRNSIKIFELLERYEVDILPGNGIPLLRAVSGKKDKVVDFFVKRIDLQNAYYLCLNVLYGEKLEEVRKTKTLSFSEVEDKILKCLLTKTDIETFEKLKIAFGKENNIYKEQFLSHINYHYLNKKIVSNPNVSRVATPVKI